MDSWDKPTAVRFALRSRYWAPLASPLGERPARPGRRGQTRSLVPRRVRGSHAFDVEGVAAPHPNPLPLGGEGIVLPGSRGSETKVEDLWLVIMSLDVNGTAVGQARG